MKLVIDMNLPEEWVPVLAIHGVEAAHWSTIGSVTAEDSKIMKWASQNGYAVFTHDLDFDALLAASGADRPASSRCEHWGYCPAKLKLWSSQL